MADLRLKIPTDGATLDTGVQGTRLFETKAGRLELLQKASTEFWGILGFEAGNDGYTLGGSAVRSVNYAFSGSYSIKIPYGTGTPSSSMVRAFTVPSSGYLVVGKAFLVTALPTASVGAAQIGAFNVSGSDFRGPHFGLAGDYGGVNKGKFCFYEGAWSYLAQISINTWYITLAIINLSANKYDLYLLDANRNILESAYSVGYHNSNPFAGQSLTDWSATWSLSIAGDLYIDAVSLGYYAHSISSPTATLLKIGAGPGVKFKPLGSGLWIPENIEISGTPQAPKYQYALLNSYNDTPVYNGSWLTQAQLRTAIGERANTVEAMMLKPQFPSDGSVGCSIDDGFIPAEMVGGGGIIIIDEGVMS